VRAPRELKDRTVLVTGAASGIGRSLARDLFWAEKSRLVLVDVDADELEVLKNELEPEGEGGRVQAVACDIASAESVAALVRAVGERPLDALVNNAGVVRLGEFERTDFAEFERVVAVNLLGTARITKAFLPHLLKSADPCVVNVASIAGLVAAPGMSGYVASKFGVVGFSEALRGELAGRVGVSVVCPTFVSTNIAKSAPAKAGAFLSKVGARPEKASAAIRRAIKQRRALTLVNADAHLMYYAQRFFPGLSRVFASAGYKAFKKMGVLEP
jgi:short-subunit dehydrogenase